MTIYLKDVQMQIGPNSRIIIHIYDANLKTFNGIVPGVIFEVELPLAADRLDHFPSKEEIYWHAKHYIPESWRERPHEMRLAAGGWVKDGE